MLRVEDMRMVYCFSCGARLDREHECACATASSRVAPRDQEEAKGARPALTLIRSLPTLPTLFDPPDLPPITAA